MNIQWLEWYLNQIDKLTSPPYSRPPYFVTATSRQAKTGGGKNYHIRNEDGHYIFEKVPDKETAEALAVILNRFMPFVFARHPKTFDENASEYDKWLLTHAAELAERVAWAEGKR